MSSEHPDTVLKDRDFTTSTDPFCLFHAWFDDAARHEPADPNAMSLATVDGQGMPNVRIVLMKNFDQEGFVFYTNLESSKGVELAATGKAALCFHWKSLARQVRIRGTVTTVTDAEANAYYESRPRMSRIGAWASRQSRPLSDRGLLERAVIDYEKKFEGKPIPRPLHWSGFRLSPRSLEFWHDRPFRLHDRLLFERDNAKDGWRTTRLYP